MIKIFTDTGADYPFNVDDIVKLPLYYYFEDNKDVEYGFDKDMEMKDFYNAMRMGRVPRTASVNIEVVKKMFERELICGNDIICISLTSGISSCYFNEVIASKILKIKFPERRIVVIDSMIGSLPQAMLAIKANDMAKNGADFDSIVKYIEDNKMFYNYEIFLEDLIYPVRGGRVNAIAGKVGQSLNIKPLIRVNSIGKTVLGTSVKGRRKLKKKLIDRMLEDGIDNVLELGIVHGDNLDDALKLREELLDLDITDDIPIAEIGQVIGSYAGPGSIGLVSKKKVKRK